MLDRTKKTPGRCNLAGTCPIVRVLHLLIQVLFSDRVFTHRLQWELFKSWREESGALIGLP